MATTVTTTTTTATPGVTEVTTSSSPTTTTTTTTTAATASSLPITDAEVAALVAQAHSLKEQGNDAFRAQRYLDALPSYTAAVTLLEPHVPEALLTNPTAAAPPAAPPAAATPTSGSQSTPTPTPAPEPELTPAMKQLVEAYSICCCNRAAAELRLAQYDAALEDSAHSAATSTGRRYVKAYQRHAEAAEALSRAAEAKGEFIEASGKLQLAVDDYKYVVSQIDPHHEPSHVELRRMEPELRRLHEKMKDEMIDKLKGFGNFLLGKVGLSLDNFVTTKDPVTGSMNIQFQQNTPAGASTSTP